MERVADYPRPPRLLENIMVAGAAAGAGETAGDPVHQSPIVHLQLDHRVQRQVALGQKLIQRLGLRRTSLLTSRSRLR